jgi:hypothetical protein
MSTLDTFERRLRDATTAVEKEIASHHQQLGALNQRLEGLKRAAELFKSEQAAVSELLQAGTANGSLLARELPTSPAATSPKPTTAAKSSGAQKWRASNTQRRRQMPRASRSASRDGGLTRVEMIAAVLKRHPRRSVRELIALLDKEYGWETTESAVTGHLYTHRDRFVHTPPDRASNRPVTWSSK